MSASNLSQNAFEHEALSLPELQTIAEFEEVIERLERHRSAARSMGSKEKAGLHRKNYIESPSDENFALLESALYERVFFTQPLGASLNQQLSSECDSALLEFARAKMLPFVRPIVEKRLALGRRWLAEITERERARHEEVSGYEAKEDYRSKAIDEAAESVRPLEMLAALTTAAGETSLGLDGLRQIFAALKTLGPQAIGSRGEAA